MLLAQTACPMHWDTVCCICVNPRSGIRDVCVQPFANFQRKDLSSFLVFPRQDIRQYKISKIINLPRTKQDFGDQPLFHQVTASDALFALVFAIRAILCRNKVYTWHLTEASLPSMYSGHTMDCKTQQQHVLTGDAAEYMWTLCKELLLWLATCHHELASQASSAVQLWEEVLRSWQSYKCPIWSPALPKKCSLDLARTSYRHSQDCIQRTAVGGLFPSPANDQGSMGVIEAPLLFILAETDLSFLAQSDFTNGIYGGLNVSQGNG